MPMENMLIRNKPNENHDLRIKGPITCWDEALPLGNGLTGCLIYGSGAPLRFSLDRGDLWDTRVAKETEAEDYRYAQLIELVKNGEHEEVSKRFDSFYFQTTPTKIPVGALELDFGKAADHVENRIVLKKALAEVTLHFNGKETVVSSFLSATQSVGFISVSGNAVIPTIHLDPPNYSSSEDVNSALSSEGNLVASLGYPAGRVTREGDTMLYVQPTCGSLSFAIAVAWVHNGDSLEIAYAIKASTDGENWLEDAQTVVREALARGFDDSLMEHEAWWDAFWNKSEITLPDTVMERQWYHTHYLFGSCSRKGAPPMPLQGVWTADGGTLPPWKGDYHNDLNTQLSYWPYMKANHLEEGESFIDLLWNLRPEAKAFAERFFEAPGICLPSVMGINGESLGGWVMYSTNLVNQIWLCQAFDHYWLYTGDLEFLEHKAYIYFRETAACVQHWLKPGPDGKLLLPLSSSPEIHDNSPAAWLTSNSNNDLALLHYLFETLKQYEELLGRDKEAKEWGDIRAQLADLAVNEDNVIMLSPDESLAVSHRHMSHLMAIYPLNLVQYERSEREKEIIEASLVQIEQLGTAQWVGYSFAWVADLYARARNGEQAYRYLHIFWDAFISGNGFHLNGDQKQMGYSSFLYRPFTLEGNMAAADALQEMLLQNHEGFIRLFPAIPDDWKQSGVSFRRFRSGMGSLVSAEFANGRLMYVTLEAERDVSLQILNSFDTNELEITQGGNTSVRVVSIGETFPIDLRSGESLLVKSVCN